MIKRRTLLTTLPAALAMPAVVRGAEPTRILIGSILSATTLAAALLPEYLARDGIKAEVINFPNITQRMQAVAAGDVQLGYGGINAAILLAAHKIPLCLLANGSEGGWNTLRAPGIDGWNALRGRKVAVQIGSTASLTLDWKLRQLGLSDAITPINMNNNDMPTALSRGDVSAIMAYEPYAAFAGMQGWGKELWLPYDSPMGRISLGLIASSDFVARNPVLMRKIVAAHVAATNRLRKDNSAAIRLIVKTLNLPLPVAQAAMKNTFFTTDSGPAFRRNVMALGQMMKQAGQVGTLPDWSRFIQTSLVS